MNYSELKNFLEILEDIPDNKKRDEAVKLMLRTATESYPRSLLGEGISEETKKKEKQCGMLLKFTEKEISKIPMRFRRELVINERLVKCRRRESGKNTTNYELRYRKHGYNISASSNDIEIAKKKFILALRAADNNVENKKRKLKQKQDLLAKFNEFADYLFDSNHDFDNCATSDYLEKNETKMAIALQSEDEQSELNSSVPTKFCEFAEYYFNTYRKRKVTKTTFNNDMYRYNNHIKPYFASKQLREITPAHCQKLLDGIAAKGHMKTNNEVYSLLNGIFKMSIAYGVISKNPLAVVIIEKHKSKHGTALTKDEERKLLKSLEGSRYQTLMAVALYTGLRPNEYSTAKIENGFIIAINSKRKRGKVEYKKIPIIEKLKPYLNGVSQLDFPRLEYMRDTFNSILPNHILYDLRTTFYTRCEECGVAVPARDEFVGHSRGELNNTYSDLSDEYLLNEGKKLVW